MPMPMMNFAARPFGVTIGVPDQGEIARGIEHAVTVRYGDSSRLQVVFEGSRGGVTNAEIANVQAKPKHGRWKRDPFYLTDQYMKVVRVAVVDLYSAHAGIRASAMQRIKQALIVGILDNVKQQKNPDGSTFTKLTPGYERRKAQMVGFIRPILRATGDLFDHMRVRVFHGKDAR